MAMLKKRLDDRKGAWEEELPVVLWAYCITVRTPMGEIPFTLAYGHEAMPLVEIGILTYWVQHFDQPSNDRKLEEQLDQLEEVRLEAAVRPVASKRRAERCFNKRVHPKTFAVEELVLKEIGTMMWDEEKLGSRWEGPYVVSATNRSGAYRLKDSQVRNAIVINVTLF